MQSPKHHFGFCSQIHIYPFLDIYIEFDLQRRTQDTVLVLGAIPMDIVVCHNRTVDAKHVTNYTDQKEK